MRKTTTRQNTVYAYLKDLINRPGIDRRGVINLLATLTGISCGSVSRWFYGTYTPQGLALVKVRVALAAVGYRVEEFYALPQELRALAEMLAYDVIDPQETSTVLGFQKTVELYRVLLHRRGMMKEDRIGKIRHLCNIYADKLVEAKRDLQEGNPIFGSLFTAGTDTADTKMGLVTLTITALKAVQTLMRGLETPLREVLENGSVDERTQVRQMFGETEFFELSNKAHQFSTTLNQLCSEKSRELIREEGV